MLSPVAACPFGLYILVAFALVFLRAEGVQSSRSSVADAFKSAGGMRGAMKSAALFSLAPDDPAKESKPTLEKPSNNTGVEKPSSELYQVVNMFGLEGDAGTHMTDIYGVKMNSERDTEALLSAISFNTFMLLFTVLVFSGLRACLPAVYSYRLVQADTGGQDERHEVNRGFFAWIGAARRAEDRAIMEQAGLDAFMLLEFCRLMQNLLLVVSPVVLLLCPLHYKFMKTDHKDFLSKVGMASVIHGKDPWWGIFYIHAGMVWYVVLASIYFINHTHQRFLQQRFSWLGKVPEPRCTTLLVENIPLEYCTDVNLKSYFIHMFGEGSIERTYVVRKAAKLRGLLAQLQRSESSLATATARWEKTGRKESDRPLSGSFLTGQQDAIEKYTAEVDKLKASVSEERTKLEDAAASTTPNSEVLATSAFITFTSLRWCRLASREQLREDTQQLALNMPPDPTDVLYESLEEDPTLQKANNILAYASVALVFLFWTPLVASASALTSLNNLKQYSSALASFCENHEFANTVLQGLLATLALKFLMSMLPTMLMFIIVRLQTLRSGRAAQLKLQNRFFAFQITFVLFVVTVGQSLSRTLEEIRSHPDRILVILATSLPDASHFYLNYVLLGWFTVAIELLRAYQCASYVCCTRCFSMGVEEARAMGEPEDQDGAGTGARFAKLGLIMTLTIVFSTVTPFIAVTGLIFFTLAGWIYRYLFLFAEIKKPDLGGVFWLQAKDHMFFALCLFVALMIGILNLNVQTGRYAALAAAPTVLVLYFAYRRLGDFNWEILPFEEIAKICDRSKDDRDRRHSISGGSLFPVNGDYIQQECRADAAK